MGRIVGALVAGVMSGMLMTSSVEAQLWVYAGGGATFPMGEYGDYAKTGWMGVVGAGVPLRVKGLLIGGEAMYGSNAHKELAGDKTNLPGAMAWAEYHIGNDGKPAPYILGLVGMLDHQFKSEQFPDLDESEWKPVFGIGVGLEIPVRGKSLFIETRYMTRDGTNFAPVIAGLSVPIGKQK